MSVYAGSTEFSGAYVGSSAVDAIYVGADKIWPALTSGTFSENLIYDEVFYVQGLSDDTAFFSSMRTNNSIPCSTAWSQRGVIYNSSFLKSWWWINNELQELNSGAKLRPWMITNLRKLRTYSTSWNENDAVARVKWLTYNEGTAAVEDLKGFDNISSNLGPTNGTYELEARDYDMLADTAYSDLEKRRFIINGCTMQLDMQQGNNTDDSGIQTMTAELDFDYDTVIQSVDFEIDTVCTMRYGTEFRQVNGVWTTVRKWDTGVFSDLGKPIPFTKDRWEGDEYDNLYFGMEDEGANGVTRFRMWTYTDNRNTTNVGQNQGYDQLNLRCNAAANWANRDITLNRTDAVFSTFNTNANFREDRWEWVWSNSSGTSPFGSNTISGDYTLRPWDAANNRGTRIKV